jgi:hypothetical protein
MDVSYRSLEIASQRLKLDRMPTKQKERLKLMHGCLHESSSFRDWRTTFSLARGVSHIRV